MLASKIALVVIVTGLGFAAQVQADELQWYFGAGAGVTTLDPDLADTSSATKDSDSTGVKLTLGRELSDHLSAEAFIADLGSARLEDGRDVDYQYAGAAMLLSFRDNNPGLSGFLKGGMAYQNTHLSGTNALNDTVQAFGGAGTEYQLNNGLTFRGEVETFTNDASWMNVSVIKRMGNVDAEHLALKHPVTVERVKLSLDPKLPVLPMPLMMSNDADGDGILDRADKCPTSPYQSEVNSRGCPVFLGLISGLRFSPASDQLNQAARMSLDRLAHQMQRYASQQFVVVGYSDNQDGHESNRLSTKRALAVSKYLVMKGISAENLRFAGQGNQQPRSIIKGGATRIRGVEVLIPSQ